MGLAAAAGDKNIIRQDGKLRYFIDEMKSMDAPKGVLNALGEIKEIAGKEEITDKDLTRVQTLVNKVQTILS